MSPWAQAFLHASISGNGFYALGRKDTFLCFPSETPQASRKDGTTRRGTLGLLPPSLLGFWKGQGHWPSWVHLVSAADMTEGKALDNRVTLILGFGI